jgi:hypothetical protein
MNRESSFDEKIERSSLGDASARKLRRRTPVEVVDSVTERVEQKRVQTNPRGNGRRRP